MKANELREHTHANEKLSRNVHLVGCWLDLGSKYDSLPGFRQQDGASPHYGTMRFRFETFAEWIGRRGTIEGPSRSFDITPMNFSIWRIVKDKVYSKKPRDLKQSRELHNSQQESLFRFDTSKLQPEHLLELHNKGYFSTQNGDVPPAPSATSPRTMGRPLLVPH
ncbi:hypothetical protein J6590_057623 [Homalodisca vitripennis]|nr:hypothetical protein J6590_057623 [Homalodisca vitripennis]